MWNQLVQSLKRLYEGGRLPIEQIDRLLAEGKINQTEHDYITENDKDEE